jgi:hypothetical protein
VTPKLANFTGNPIVRDVGIIRPPADFQSLIMSQCTDPKAFFEVEAINERCYLFSKGPYLLIRQKTDNKTVKKFDLRNLHSLITDRSSAVKIRLQDDQNPDLSIELKVADIRERDLLHLKLGTWCSYWESMKTNKVLVRLS